MNDSTLLRDIRALKEAAWLNPHLRPTQEALATCPLTLIDVLDAEARLRRFADYIRIAFPETEAADGIIESPLREIPNMKQALSREHRTAIPGRLLLKMDSHLPISGSIKARGGIYEVLKTAEDIALEHHLIAPGQSYSRFADADVRNVLSRYSIAVGSTGNLGLSIGIMSAKLGFRVTVHMSADARQWKKDLLRARGVNVIEYPSDYSIAVAEGRKEAENDPYCHFIDDENSKTLFLGYAVAALRLKRQLTDMRISVDAQHPLFVYLPCGVGGGPGGVAFGLKLMFGDHVHCFFAEPTHSCCMMLGLATGLHGGISVTDVGLDNRTAADGLAVGRASQFVGRVIEPFLSGCYSLSDERMYHLLTMLADEESILLEPSALAGMQGPVLLASGALSDYPDRFGMDAQALSNGTQLIWATGGSMVPPDIMQEYREKGRAIAHDSDVHDLKEGDQSERM